MVHNFLSSLLRMRIQVYDRDATMSWDQSGAADSAGCGHGSSSCRVVRNGTQLTLFEVSGVGEWQWCVCPGGVFVSGQLPVSTYLFDFNVESLLLHWRWEIIKWFKKKPHTQLVNAGAVSSSRRCCSSLSTLHGNLSQPAHALRRTSTRDH